MRSAHRCGCRYEDNVVTVGNHYQDLAEELSYLPVTGANHVSPDAQEQSGPASRRLSADGVHARHWRCVEAAHHLVPPRHAAPVQ
jgi:hypothetical protein